MKFILDYVVVLKFKIKILYMLKGIDNLNWFIYFLKFVVSIFILYLKVYFFYIYIKFRNNVIFNSELVMFELLDLVLMYLGFSNFN